MNPALLPYRPTSPPDVPSPLLTLKLHKRRHCLVIVLGETGHDLKLMPPQIGTVDHGLQAFVRCLEGRPGADALAAGLIDRRELTHQWLPSRRPSFWRAPSSARCGPHARQTRPLSAV